MKILGTAPFTVIAKTGLEVTFQFETLATMAGKPINLQFLHLNPLAGCSSQSIVKPKSTHARLNIIHQARIPLFPTRTGQLHPRCIGVAHYAQVPSEKSGRKWNDRRYSATALTLRDANGMASLLIFYSAQITGDFEEGDFLFGFDRRFPKAEGMVFSYEHPDLNYRQPYFLGEAALFPLVEDLRRFPKAFEQVDRMSVSRLEVGAQVGVPKPNLMLPGYDQVLADLGFPNDQSGCNALTNHRVPGFSMPWQPPSADLWKRLPDVLRPLLPLQLLSDLEWGAELSVMRGRRLTSIEAGPEPCVVHGPHGATTRRCAKESNGVPATAPQPCYNGPSESIERIGVRFIFTVRHKGYRLYVMDSPYPHREIALRVYATLEDARKQCEGKDTAPLVRLCHDDGWQQRLPSVLDRVVAEHAQRLQVVTV